MTGRRRADAIYWEDYGLVFTTRTGRPLSHRNVDAKSTLVQATTVAYHQATDMAVG